MTPIANEVRSGFAFFEHNQTIKQNMIIDHSKKVKLLVASIKCNLGSQSITVKLACHHLFCYGQLHQVLVNKLTLFPFSLFMQRTVDMMLRKQKEVFDSENQVSPQIDCLLLIDRNVDLLTPLCTQLTYEGLIDEIYGIHNSTYGPV